ncbi:hypothetical protein RQP46_009706 [Phenoliferia psychrophenolica]
MATIDSLANETLAHIMEMLKKPTIITWRDSTSPSPARYDALRAAALVCSRWKDPAQRALFDDVQLDYRYTRRYKRFLASPVQSRYRTRSLRVLGHSWGAALEVADASMPLLCPALRESDVGPHLECLILNAPYQVLQGYIDIFPLFEALKSFSWHSFDVPNSLRIYDVEDLRTILDAFPSPATLLHLSIGIDNFSSLEHIITLLGHPTLSLITNLDLPVLPVLPSLAPAEEASVVVAMAQACQDRGIQWSMGGVVQ